MLLQVHDELIFELHRDESALLDEIKTLMSDALPLDVPVIVDCGTGRNWLEAH
jgi:DNA polymerase-1